MSKINGKIVDAMRVGRTDAGRVIGRSLKNLREVAGLTQIEMAKRLNVGQAAISKIEQRGDVQISSLEKYVEALGATLRIDASFPRDGDFALRCGDGLGQDIIDTGQLILPIFNDDIFKQQKDIVLSVKPQYSKEIMEGRKTVELRRRFPVTAPRGTLAYIYATSPVCAIVGRAEITDVVKMRISDIWQKFSESVVIEKSDFESYFTNLQEGYALMFANIRPFSRPLLLSELREKFGFEPPQSFLYAKPILQEALHHEYSDLSH